MTASNFRPPEERGILPFKLSEYGRSELGASLLFAPCAKKCELLCIAGIHGEEPETTFLLSRVLRHFKEPLAHTAFVLCANPDGAALGTRGNANGVDLNRNFPTQNWSAEITLSRASLESDRTTRLYTGRILDASSRGNDKNCNEKPQPASELETRALIELITRLNPPEILSIHSPLACVESPQKTPLVNFLVELSQTEYKTEIGYPTPGSLGTWCAEAASKTGNGIHCVTWELPRLAPEILWQKFAKKLAEFLLSLH